MAPRTPQRLPKSHPRTATTRKKRSGASPSKRSVAKAIPGWLWLVAGVGVGMLATSLIKLSDVPQPASQPVAVQQPKPTRPVAKSAPAQQPKAEKPEPGRSETRFDFYTLLPEREVIVPDQRDMKPAPKPEKATAATAPKSTSTEPPAAAASGERYLLQAGSFRRETEADRRRAQILLLGLEARIEPVQANGDTWYRVHAGPFVSQERVAQAREMLSGEGIETLLLKQRPAG